MKIGQLLCGLLRQHDYHVEFKPESMKQVCQNCGHQRPGWVMDTAKAVGLDNRKMTARQARKLELVKKRKSA